MKHRLHQIGLALSTLFLTACSSASFFIANLPVKSADITRHENISYGEQAWQKLDIYSAKGQKSNAPVIVFFHGGRWSFGNKKEYAFAALPFIEKGYIVVIPDYAKYPKVKFPAFMNDPAQAVAWTYDNISQYGGNRNRLYLSGHSSGAHMAALLVADPEYLKKFGKSQNIITAFAGLAGPYDFIPEDRDLKDMFGPPERYPQMQVTTFINGKQPPMLLLHGAEDKTVIEANLRKLEAGIHKKGGIVEEKIYPGVDHKEIVGALSWIWSDKAPVSNDIMTFFEKYK